ncbi:hypothetical protein [Sphingorhabdus sp.]|uniref:DUF7933 domain-containing protein n=1 Tax=Sphingorhabdus sp. TaxID=1902408 RepID=UPI003BB09897|nr:DUF11 domain-containing protein [Sphingomonadales bacterium]MBK9431001.1 DUF11 domain-containing protein [Sphingomonadales bacterium]
MYLFRLIVGALLLSVLFPNIANAQLLVNKSFSPANIPPAATSTLTIQIFNNTATAATAVNLTDNLPTSPTGLTIGPGGLLSNSCGGTVTATPGTTTVTLTGGAVAASSGGVAGQCTITVQVQTVAASAGQSYSNTIPIANVSSSIGGSVSPATATLSVSGVNAITGSKTFTPTNLHGNGPATRMRIQLNNSNSFPLTNVAFTDNFPTQLELAATPNVSNSCGGAVTAVGGGFSLALSGGTIPASGNCVIQADVVARLPNTSPNDGNATNSIAANNVTSAQGARNTAAISRTIRVQKAASVTKAFSPAGIVAGGSSTLTITLRNFNATAISGFNFTDTMPAGITVVGPATTTCGGTASFTATSLTVTGGNLAAAPSGIGSTSCTLTATVTAPANGSFANSVPAGNLAGISYSAASATLVVSSVAVSKAFSLTTVPRTGVTTLTITLINRTTTGTATVTSFTDNLNTMGANIAIAASPAATTTCGGTLTAGAGTTPITLTGGTIPAAASAAVPGTCTITVPVQVGNTAATGTRTNTIAVNGLQTNRGNNNVAAAATVSVAAPLTVSKAFLPTTVARNGVTRITVTITRAANAALFTGLAMTDPLPSGWTVAPTPSPTTTCTGGTVTAVSGATSFSLSGASLGTVITSSASCTVAVNVRAPTTLGVHTNTIPIGNVTANTAVGAVSNVAAGSAAVTVVDGVSINKSFSPISIIPGGTSRITIFINNPSSIGIAMTGATLTDNLPSGLVIQSPANATFTATSGTCTGLINAVPGTGTFGISSASISSGAICELAVDVTTNAVGTLTNTIPANNMTSTQGLSNVNSSSASLLSSGNADVAVTKSDPVATMVAGTNTTYTITITNNSSALAVAGLPVEDDETADLTFPAWTCAATPGSSCAAPSGTGAIATTVTLAPLGVATFTLTATANPDSMAATVENIAIVDPAAAGVFDPVSINNQASDINTLTRSADVRVTKTASPLAPPVGGPVAFTITAINDGPSTARAIEVTDALPTGYTFVSATPGVGSFADPDWTVGDLSPGTNATLVINATVNPTGDYQNVATITTTTPDPLATNNTATLTPSTVGLRIEKSSSVLSDGVSGSNPKAIPGAIIEYRITVFNEGTAAIDSDSIVIEDIMPGSISSYVSTVSGMPVTFVEGPNPSGLTFTYATDVGWSNQTGGGPPFTYAPSPDVAGYDGAVTGIRINPKGTMAAGSLASPSSFTIVIRARVD